VPVQAYWLFSCPQKNTHIPDAEDVGSEISFFGNPAVRVCAPMGFASPGYPGFTSIGKKLLIFSNIILLETRKCQACFGRTTGVGLSDFRGAHFCFPRRHPGHPLQGSLSNAKTFPMQEKKGIDDDQGALAQDGGAGIDDFMGGDARESFPMEVPVLSLNFTVVFITR
jgi:hypothetical protein